jgi:hypothetical protein
MTAPTWHADPAIRRAIGDTVEDQFRQTVRCHCGGSFAFTGDAYRGAPDYTCENCGLLVDVKASPQSERTGNISVSVRPWDGYPEDLLLVTLVGERWLAEYKRNIVTTGPFPSTHNGTSYCLIAWCQFKEISEFGLKIGPAPNGSDF